MVGKVKTARRDAPLSVISLFTGLGGMDYGLEAAGFETRVAVEMNKHAVDALRLNRKWPVLKGNVNKVPIDLLLRTARLKPREADVLIGGPPCFTAGHLVLAERGYVPIEDLRVGDRVVTHRGRLGRVVRVGSKESRVGTLTGVGMGDATGEPIVCTPDHPFMSVGLDAADSVANTTWTPASEMPGRGWCTLTYYDVSVPGISTPLGYTAYAIGSMTRDGDADVPAWVLSHQYQNRREFLRGVFGVHCDALDGIDVILSKRAAAYGVAAALTAEGHTVAVSECPRGWRVSAANQPAAVLAQGYAIRPVQDYVPGGEARVYNVEVEGDHSYVVNGAVVHNCQPYSAAGHGTGRAMQMDDPRAATLMGYMRVVRHTLPKVFVMENVPQLGAPGKDTGLRVVLREVERINAACGTKYLPTLAIVRATSYGVPQIRSRLIIVAARDGRKFRFPDPTHVDPSELHAYGKGVKPFTTAWDAIGDLKEPKNPRKVGGKWDGLLESIPEGENWAWFSGAGGRPKLFEKGKFSYTLRKLAKDRPSWTVMASLFTTNGPFHWNSRPLTFREMCRIQTIPDDVRVVAPYSEERRMAGNAVPSLMAEVIGRAIREQLLDRPMKGPLKLLPPNRGKPPAPARPRPLNPKFVALAKAGKGRENQQRSETSGRSTGDE